MISPRRSSPHQPSTSPRISRLMPQYDETGGGLILPKHNKYLMAAICVLLLILIILRVTKHTTPLKTNKTHREKKKSS
ncbi:hypothetical protein BP00DRAFT_426991 [Aspergillus indologenus CBS 114.80]|uniref:Uncharacterized protein n=1 Tax=Aspergillus indologenus CBS 114.80 TaxID=1450541 RepID=A0A2V5I1Q8_9EURO|nr:hypothetical protein BP00DRAFT_426991 [Aspergillus indologenus CBS 114.80]